MKLNPDCVRDVMLCVEEKLAYNGMLTGFEIANELSCKYSDSEIFYSAEQLIIRGWLKKCDFDGLVAISDILPPGHDFLANARSLNVWEDVKTKFREKGIEAAIDIMGLFAKKIVESKLGVDLP